IGPAGLEAARSRCDPRYPRDPGRGQVRLTPRVAHADPQTRTKGGHVQMAVKVGINGFGRIGRQSLKALIERSPDVEVVAVNDLVDVETNALLFKHDSTYGAYPGTVEHTDDAIVV